MRLLIFICALLLSSCGLIQDRSSEYVQAASGQAIKIPDSLLDRQIQSQYPIPSINNKRPLEQEYELPKPPNVTASLDEAPFTIDEVAGQVWLSLYLAPGKVWPLLDAFWQAHDIEVVEENISKGLVITNTVADTTKLNAALPNPFSFNNVSFQAKLSQGIRRNTSEIKLKVLEPTNLKVEKTWSHKSTNLNRDKALLTAMESLLLLTHYKIDIRY